MRKWSIAISVVNSSGKEVAATIFDKVTYHLHPTFPNPVRQLKKPPFKLEEQGWGEFDMSISLTLADKAGDRKIQHDLNFLKEKYTVDHVITIPVKSGNQTLNKLLAETGYVPGTADDSIGDKRKSPASMELKNKKAKTGAVKGNVDLEGLAEGLTKLSEDDLLGVVQIVNDNKTAEMNVKNDVDQGEFTMDLYTLPDQLLRSLWDYVKKRVE